MAACNDPFKDEAYQINDLTPNSTYLESRPELSEWVKILKYTDLLNAVNQASMEYTLFVPTNEAVAEFYKKLNISSIEDKGKYYALDLVKFHIITEKINQETFLIGGRLTTPNASENYLTVSFDTTGANGGGLNGIYVNDEAQVKELAQETTNGYIYILGSVLTPLVETVTDRLEQHDYKIMLEAIRATGWDKQLNTTYDTTYNSLGGRVVTKKNFTLLTVSDATFNEAGITSAETLAQKLGAGSDYTNEDNELYKYIGYHTLGSNKYMNDFFSFAEGDSATIWSPMANGEVFGSYLVGNKRYLNYLHSTDDGVQFVEEKCDIIARNGIIHEIDELMPVIAPEAVPVIWDFLDYPQVETFINALSVANETYAYLFNSMNFDLTDKSGKEYQAELVGMENTPYTHKAYSAARKTATLSGAWGGSKGWAEIGYLACKWGSADKRTKALEGNKTANSYGAYNHNLFILNLGTYGWVQMESPVLLAGKYKVELIYGSAGSIYKVENFRKNGVSTQFILDETQTCTVPVYKGQTTNGSCVMSYTLFEEITFDQRSSHILKVVNADEVSITSSDYRLMLDYIKFTPITE